MAESRAETTCGSLLRELQHIWDEVGESDGDRDKMLLQLEQECLDVYRRKVEQASGGRVLLHEAIADAEAEIASLCKALGDRHAAGKGEKRGNMTLKEQLQAMHPYLEELRKKKEDRLKRFADVKEQIQNILIEIAGGQLADAALFSTAGEQDLSLARLDEYHTHLQALQKEKAERLLRVSDDVTAIKDLCAVLCVDFMKMVADVHPNLANTSSNQAMSISDDTLDGLKLTIQSLQLEKRQRLTKLQDLCASLVGLWNLMDTPLEEQSGFQLIISLVEAKDNEICSPGILSFDNVEKAEEEVQRLDMLKASRMKELIMKKLEELNQIYMEAHMEPDPDTAEEKFMAIIDSGLFDATELLERMDKLIDAVTEEALSRKDIMEKMEKWLSACEEESWLDDYNQDENRYNASRGAHINLKRAERARVTIQKLPAMVEALMAKTKGWEESHGTPFLYDGVRLLDVLEEHNAQRKEKEQERRRVRDQKRVQEQMMTEQEALFGSRPSPHKPVSAKKGLSLRANGSTNTPNRRLSMGGALLQAAGNNGEAGPRKNGITPGRKDGGSHKHEKTRTAAAPVNYVALSKEDSVAVA